jgi:hypothetical protein
VISLLNRYFVPVYLSNEDYAKEGAAPAEEKAERDRIYREALKAQLSTGTVHVYILGPDGHPIDSQHVAVASKVEKLTEMLERTVEKLKLAEGKPLVKAVVQSVAPKADADSLVLHLTARTLTRKGDEWVPVKPTLGETRSSGWGAYAVEDWIVLTKDECAKFLPEGDVMMGTSWDLNRDVAAKVLKHFYPSTENNNVAKNRIDEQQLRATVLSVKEGVVRARLDGGLKMRHSFYHKDDDNSVDATIVGILDYDAATKTIRSLQLATDRATYGRTNFGVVVRSEP